MPVKKILALWKDDGVDAKETETLRKHCLEVPIPFHDETEKGIKYLVDTFLDRDDAVGLAAPQIGISKRIIVFRNKGFDNDEWEKSDYEVLVNPRITQQRGELVTMVEGCLSCPEIQVEIARYPEIKVKALNAKGEKINKRYNDFLARVVQHEMDHLDGKLIVDYEGTIYYPKKKQKFFEDLFK